MSEERIFYTVSDIQKILGISRPTVYKLLKRREFPWISVGGNAYRILRSGFDEWINENMHFNRDITDEVSAFQQLLDNSSRRSKN